MAEQCTGRGAKGVVCAAAPLAAQAGTAALREGGNAFDAVVSAALAETVLLPSKCGLGGDLVAIVSRAGSSRPDALIAIGGAPAGLAGLARGGEWTDTGPTSVGPPAAPAGYVALAAAGRLPFDRLAAPALELATGGFPWAAVNHRLTVASVELLHRWNPAGTVYLPDGDPIAAGALVRLPGLAAALASFVELGDRFLAGPVGEAIAADRPRPRRRPRTRRPWRGTRRVGGMRRDPDRPAHRCTRRRRRPTVRRCSLPSRQPRPATIQRRNTVACWRRSPNSTTRSPIRRARRSSARPTRTATPSSSCIPTPTRGTAAAWSSPTTTLCSPIAPAEGSIPTPATPTSPSRVAARRRRSTRG